MKQFCVDSRVEKMLIRPFSAQVNITEAYRRLICVAATQNLPLVERRRWNIYVKKISGPQLLASDAWERKNLFPWYTESHLLFIVVFANRPSWWILYDTRTERQQIALFYPVRVHLPISNIKTHNLFPVDSNNDLCFYAAVFYIFGCAASTHGTFLFFYVGAFVGKHSPQWYMPGGFTLTVVGNLTNVFLCFIQHSPVLFASVHEREILLWNLGDVLHENSYKYI